MTAHQNDSAAAFSGLIDLASEKIGGKALYSTDDFFAGKENLLKPGRGVFIPDKYTDRGKWMDGWESRRKRVPGHDFAIIKLGLGGKIKGVDIDTNHFLGNHPPYASLEAAHFPIDFPLDDLLREEVTWTEILKKSPLRPGSQNLFGVSGSETWTHLKLHIYPDGGVARLRVYGEVDANLADNHGEPIDLAAIVQGGRVVACSDMFFGPMDNLIMPGRAAHMGEGWETRRKRGPGHDWAVVQLAATGKIQKIEVDTNHFKGNYPDRCSLDFCLAKKGEINSLNAHTMEWKPLLPETKLEADRQHLFFNELLHRGEATHVRINIFPDGGISRLRLFGTPSKTESPLESA